jgi:pyrroline-5-carboxylate reductase
MNKKIVLVGCGKMGSALLEGWLEVGLPKSNIFVIEPNLASMSKTKNYFGVNCAASHNDLPKNLNPNAILFAVKPQLMNMVIPNYIRFNIPKTTFISIAAGKPTIYFEKYFKPKTSIIRAMPNTPASIRRGITVAYANKSVKIDEKETATILLKAGGELHWVIDESLIDTVTALSGGGPAYVFLLVECLSKAGIEAGLPPELSSRLARVTVSGSGELLHRSSESPSTLRESVTSPGGTTAEALRVLMTKDKLQSMISRAIAAAKQKSRELAS